MPDDYVDVYVAEGRAAAGNPVCKAMLDVERKVFGLAVKKGAKIAYGTDAGGYPWTENQAKEFSYMVRWGMTPMQAIQSATVVAAELLQGETWCDRAGNVADIIAVDGDPLQHIEDLEHVKFVMKGGQIYKDGPSK